MAKSVECAPFRRVILEPIAILIERLQLQFGEPTTQSFAHLPAYFTKTFPPQAQARQRPLQKGYKLLIAHRELDLDGLRIFTSSLQTQPISLASGPKEIRIASRIGIRLSERPVPNLSRPPNSTDCT